MPLIVGEDHVAAPGEGWEEATNPEISEGTGGLKPGGTTGVLDSFDIDADLADDVQPIVGSIGRAVVHL